MDEPEFSDLEIESPISLLPDLHAWGIEEVDKGVCEDTSENRKTIRDNKATFLPVYDSLGNLTKNIQVITQEMRVAALASSKHVLLTDTRNVDSDYITGVMLIVEPAADNLVPAWVMAATRNWLKVAEKRKTVPNFRPYLIGPTQRCISKKVDGHRCTLWTNGTENYGEHCRIHLANRPGDRDGAGHLAKARNRLENASNMAVDALEQLVQEGVSEPVRLGAARDILDRAGIRAGFDNTVKVDVTVNHADEVRKRLDKLKGGLEAKAALEARLTGTEELEDGEPVEEAVLIEDDEDES